MKRKKHPKVTGDGLTDDENRVMDKIIECYETYCNLDPGYSHPDDKRKFVEAIHTIQEILMCRIVRREHPGDWTVIQEKRRKNP